MPALSTLDAFTDSDKALASHTPDYSDYAWANHGSFGTAASLYGNRAVPGNTESVAYLSLAVPDRSTEDWGVEAPVYYAGTQSGSYGGLFAGVTGAKTGYVCYWYGGTWALGKYVAGTWTGLGTYSESFSTGTSKAIRMRFTSTQVILSIDGTDRITVSDSSITPTRMGVYGDRAILGVGNTGFHLSDISFVGRAILNPARETDAAVALTVSKTVTLTPATETDAAVALTVTKPQHVTLTPATETDVAVGLTVTSGGTHVTLSPAWESDVAVPLSWTFPVPQEITLTPALEQDTAVALVLKGAMTMNMQLAPGTVVGAYLRHEWIGSEVPVRGAGSYPGPLVAEATVDDYGEVAFRLNPGSYIAWAEDYPLRRRFFVVEAD